MIFLQSVSKRPNTGAIYVYNESLRVFLWLRFDRDDDLNGPDFDRAVWAYRLLKWVDLGSDRLVRARLSIRDSISEPRNGRKPF
jgi:hypothetical protein